MFESSRRILHVVVNPSSQDPNGPELRRAIDALQRRIDNDKGCGIHQPVELISTDTQFDWDADMHNVVVFDHDGVTPVGAAQLATVEYTVRDEEGEYIDKFFTLLHTLYVLPECRRQGIGRMLMNAATACTEGSSHMEIDVAPNNVIARNFYASVGFRAESLKMTRTASDVVPADSSELDAECEDIAPPVFTFGTPTDAELITMHAAHLREVPHSVIEIIRPDHAKGYTSFCARVDGELAAVIQTVATAGHERELRRIYALPEYRKLGIESKLCSYFNVSPTLLALSMLCPELPA
jgi:GNAT superfamily N-acetyltransferase